MVILDPVHDLDLQTKVLHVDLQQKTIVIPEQIEREPKITKEVYLSLVLVDLVDKGHQRMVVGYIDCKHYFMLLPQESLDAGLNQDSTIVGDSIMIVAGPFYFLGWDSGAGDIPLAQGALSACLEDEDTFFKEVVSFLGIEAPFFEDYPLTNPGDLEDAGIPEVVEGVTTIEVAYAGVKDKISPGAAIPSS